MKRTNRTFLIAVAVLLAASACVSMLPVPASPPTTAPPTAVGTELDQGVTASALPALPTSTQPQLSMTPSITMTPFPSITPLPTATATMTETPFGFVASHTPAPPTIAVSVTIPAVDPVDGATDDWGSDYRCTLISKSPANGTIVPALQKYKVSWTLYNSGVKKWPMELITLDFVSGANMSTEKRVQLTRDVKPNDSISPVVNIYPPKTPGTYRSVWGLRVVRTGHVFCTVTVQITVTK